MTTENGIWSGRRVLVTGGTSFTGSNLVDQLVHQAHNVGRFSFELRIIAGQVTLQAMGFQASLFPDPIHSVLADSQRCRQFAAIPMCGTVAGFLAGGRENRDSLSLLLDP
jgi:hypothetical protein